MESIKVVVRYAGGRVLKGFTQDFHPNKELFHLHPVAETAGKPVEILLKDLKAVFFVRDFAGNPDYNETKNYLPHQKSQGRKVEVEFRDGEVLVGSTLGYDPKRQGFFLFPADSGSNNIRIFTVTAAVENVRYV